MSKRYQILEKLTCYQAINYTPELLVPLTEQIEAKDLDEFLKIVLTQKLFTGNLLYAHLSGFWKIRLISEVLKQEKEFGKPLNVLALGMGIGGDWYRLLSPNPELEEKLNQFESMKEQFCDDDVQMVKENNKFMLEEFYPSINQASRNVDHLVENEIHNFDLWKSFITNKSFKIIEIETVVIPDGEVSDHNDDTTTTSPKRMKL